MPSDCPRPPSQAPPAKRSRGAKDSNYQKGHFKISLPIALKPLWQAIQRNAQGVTNGVLFVAIFDCWQNENDQEKALQEAGQANRCSVSSLPEETERLPNATDLTANSANEAEGQEAEGEEPTVEQEENYKYLTVLEQHDISPQDTTGITNVGVLMKCLNGEPDEGWWYSNVNRMKYL